MKNVPLRRSGKKKGDRYSINVWLLRSLKSQMENKEHQILKQKN